MVSEVLGLEIALDSNTISVTTGTRCGQIGLINADLKHSKWNK
jgi:hypothetical protein